VGVTKEEAPVGIVTERDVLRLAARGAIDAATVSSAMTAPPDTIDAGTPLEGALATMRERGFRHMPVTRNGELAGIVSLRDLARLATVGPVDVPRGLKGVVVADTEVGDVRGREGFYHYRQYSAVDLAVSRPLEDVWRLLIDGALPQTVAQRNAFIDEVRPWRHIPDTVARSLRAIAASCGALDGLTAALSIAAAERGMRPVYDTAPEERRQDALFVSALAPSLLAVLYRLRNGLEVVSPRDDLSAAANFLWMVTGTEPDGARTAAIERYLISTIDHGFNASTFTARVVASTGAGLAACITAGISALSGPLHGGAPSRALDLLDEIGTAARAREVVTAKVAAGERIMGFGHAVYRTDDPRSVMLRDVARGLGGPLVDLAEAVEQTVIDVLEELKPGRELYTNVEYYAGVVMSICGIPAEMFTPTFASSRVIGWCANVLEQAADPKIIRPSARYVGPTPPQPVPPISL
jgi:citrate synthase